MRNIGWIAMYVAGIILFSLYNILQEKYIIHTKDTSFENKIRFAFYSGLFQIIVIGCSFWIDILFGYSNGIEGFANSFIQSFFALFEHVTTMLLIQLFVFDCLALFVISIYLNEISTNYNMILTNLTNQSVALFFTIFPSFNTGIQYPIYVTALSMLCNILSVIFWIKCELNKSNDIDQSNDINQSNDIDQSNDTNQSSETMKLTANIATDQVAIKIEHSEDEFELIFYIGSN